MKLVSCKGRFWGTAEGSGAPGAGGSREGKRARRPGAGGGERDRGVGGQSLLDLRHLVFPADETGELQGQVRGNSGGKGSAGGRRLQRGKARRPAGSGRRQSESSPPLPACLFPCFCPEK